MREILITFVEEELSSSRVILVSFGSLISQESSRENAGNTNCAWHTFRKSENWPEMKFSLNEVKHFVKKAAVCFSDFEVEEKKANNLNK